jgi:micrococcal nuclease
MNKILPNPIVISFILIFSFNVFAATYTARVIGIHDGDTIKVLKDNRQLKIRLYGIDCPEKRQAFGKKAKQFTSNFVYGRDLIIKKINRDRYGRTIALVYVGNKCLNAELIKNGYAWVYLDYCHKSFCSQWIKYQNRAKNRRRGLWAQPNPLAPWKFRKK